MHTSHRSSLLPDSIVTMNSSSSNNNNNHLGNMSMSGRRRSVTVVQPDKPTNGEELAVVPPVVGGLGLSQSLTVKSASPAPSFESSSEVLLKLLEHDAVTDDVLCTAAMHIINYSTELPKEFVWQHWDSTPSSRSHVYLRVTNSKPGLHGGMLFDGIDFFFDCQPYAQADSYCCEVEELVFPETQATATPSAVDGGGAFVTSLSIPEAPPPPPVHTPAPPPAPQPLQRRGSSTAMTPSSRRVPTSINSTTSSRSRKLSASDHNHNKNNNSKKLSGSKSPAAPSPLPPPPPPPPPAKKPLRRDMCVCETFKGLVSGWRLQVFSLAGADFCLLRAYHEKDDDLMDVYHSISLGGIARAPIPVEVPLALTNKWLYGEMLRREVPVIEDASRVLRRALLHFRYVRKLVTKVHTFLVSVKVIQRFVRSTQRIKRKAHWHILRTWEQYEETHSGFETEPEHKERVIQMIWRDRKTAFRQGFKVWHAQAKVARKRGLDLRAVVGGAGACPDLSWQINIEELVEESTKMISYELTEELQKEGTVLLGLEDTVTATKDDEGDIPTLDEIAVLLAELESRSVREEMMDRNMPSLVAALTER